MSLETPARRLPYVAGVAGATFIAFSAVLVRFADVAPSTAAVFRTGYALPVLALLAAWERARWGPRLAHDRVVALAAGALFAADLIFLHYTIGAVGAGLATVLANGQVVFVGVAAWLLLGERPRREVLLAVPVMLAGVLCISGGFSSEAYGEDPVAGGVFGLLTAATYAGFILLLRRGNRDARRPAGPLLDASLSATLVAIAAGLAIGDLEFAPSWPAHGWLLALALNSQVAGWLLISISLPRLPALATSVLLLLQPVGSVALGAALLEETPSFVQLLGVGAVLGGMVLATSARRPAARLPGRSAGTVGDGGAAVRNRPRSERTRVP